MDNRYTSIRIILDKILRHPLLRDLTLETVVDYTIDFMRIVGVPSMFEDKTAILHIEEYRALLPCDYHAMTQVRLLKDGKPAFRASTDSFHLSECKDRTNKSLDLTYKIQGNVIYTSIIEGDIEIAYKAIAVDKDFYPLIPDNSSFTRALELYIKKQWFTILFDLGKIQPAILQNVQQEYAWAVGDCQTEFNRMSLDEAESFFNSWRTLLIRDNEHAYGFINNGAKELIKLQ